MHGCCCNYIVPRTRSKCTNSLAMILVLHCDAGSQHGDRHSGNDLPLGPYIYTVTGSTTINLQASQLEQDLPEVHTCLATRSWVLDPDCSPYCLEEASMPTHNAFWRMALFASSSTGDIRALELVQSRPTGLCTFIRRHGILWTDRTGITNPDVTGPCRSTTWPRYHGPPTPERSSSLPTAQPDQWRSASPSCSGMNAATRSR